MAGDIHAAVLAEAEAELAEVEAKAAALRAVVAYHRARTVSPVPVVGMGDSVPLKPPESKPLQNLSQSEAAAFVLKRAGRPMKTAELAEAMIRAGFPVRNPKQLKTSLFTSLLRKPDVFEKIDSGLWKIVD